MPTAHLSVSVSTRFSTEEFLLGRSVGRRGRRNISREDQFTNADRSFLLDLKIRLEKFDRTDETATETSLGERRGDPLANRPSKISIPKKEDFVSRRNSRFRSNGSIERRKVLFDSVRRNRSKRRNSPRSSGRERRKSPRPHPRRVESIEGQRRRRRRVLRLVEPIEKQRRKSPHPHPRRVEPIEKKKSFIKWKFIRPTSRMDR